MRLPINIEELLGGRAVEGDRIEYKAGWNPDAIYRSVCAFANDFDETGGGYIVVGVKEVNGRPVRPVIGIDPNQIEPIEKDMVGFNNLMQPYYQPRLYIETDEERTYFLIDIPCHPYFAKKEIEIDTSGAKENVEIGVKDGVKGGAKELSDIQVVIVKEMLFDPSVTTSEMAQKTGIKFRTLQRHISQLQAMGIVVRKDGRKDGYWEVVKNK